MPAPATQEIQVYLVRLGAGDPVVVGAEDKLAPCFVQRRVRHGRAQDIGQGRQSFGVREAALSQALGLLGIDEGDVLAGVNGVHVPRLR